MHDRMHRPSLGVLCPVNQAPDAGVHDRSRTHGAGLNGHEQIATRQAIIADCCARLAQSHYFGMSARIGIGQVAIEAAAYDFSFMDDYRADRHLASFLRALS